MTPTPLRAAVRARLLALWADLRAAASLRRREKRLSTYLLRLACMALILIVLPVQKLVQLGLVGFLLATLKTALAAAVVVALLAAVFALDEWRARRAATRG